MTSIHEYSRRHRTYLVAVLCLSGAIFSGYRLIQNFNAGSLSGVGPPIAQLVKIDAKIRRKASSSYVWESAKNNESLYNRDSVQSGPNSSALIELNDGRRLELGENSLVVLDTVKDLTLNFMFGSFVVRSTAGDRQVKVAHDGSQKVTELAFRLLTPASHERLFLVGDDKQIVSFAWETKKNSESPTTLQISNNPRFLENNVKSVNVPMASLGSNVELAAGNYYWRLTHPNESSEVRNFHLDRVEPLVPVSPNEYGPILISGEQNATPFRWNSGETKTYEQIAEHPQNHILQISASKDFGSVLRTLEIEPATGFTKVEKLVAGSYFWRIRSQYGKTEVVSPVQAFRVEQVTHLELHPTQPSDAATVSAKNPVRFAWDCNLPDTDFELEIVSAPAGKPESPILLQKISSSSWVWKPTNDGMFKWRIKAFAAASAGSAQSQPVLSPFRSLSVFEGDDVRLVIPENGFVFYYWDTPAPLAFSWKNDPMLKDGNKYRLAVSNAADLSNVALIAPTLAALTDRPESSFVPTSNGIHYWQVSIVDPANHVLKSSPVRKFFYDVHPILEAPVPTSPANETILKISDPSDLPTLTWEPNEQAHGYRVELRGPNKRRWVTQVSEPKFKPSHLKNGAYEWTVQSIDRLQRAGKTSAGIKFTLDMGPKLTAPQDVGAEVR
jgi:hypothetical protein